MPQFTCIEITCKHTVTTVWKPLKCGECGGPVLPHAEALLKHATQLMPFAVTPVAVRIDQILIALLEQFDERAVGLLMRVCKQWKRVAEIVLRKYVTEAYGFGSGSGEKIKQQILRLLDNRTSLSLAVDKFMPVGIDGQDSILAYIVKKNIRLTLKLGTPNPQLLEELKRAARKSDFLYQHHEIQTLKKEKSELALLKYEVETIEHFRKLSLKLDQGHVQTGLMHNKFWILDGDRIITGSPNVSWSALEGGNFESCIYIRSPKLAPLFQRYFELLSTPYSKQSLAWADFGKQLTRYNLDSRRVKAAFAPTVNISNFIVEHLVGATKITVRQFLISTAGSDDTTSIVPFLCNMAQGGGGGRSLSGCFRL